MGSSLVIQCWTAFICRPPRPSCGFFMSRLFLYVLTMVVASCSVLSFSSWCDCLGFYESSTFWCLHHLCVLVGSELTALIIKMVWRPRTMRTRIPLIPSRCFSPNLPSSTIPQPLPTGRSYALRACVSAPHFHKTPSKRGLPLWALSPSTLVLPLYLLQVTVSVFIFPAKSEAP